MQHTHQTLNTVMSLPLQFCCLLLLSGLLLLPSRGWAYRPFVSTDADVVEDGEIEIELGYFNWEREEDENTYVTPQLVINYGITKSLELVAEFDVEHLPGGKSQLVDPGLFLKAVLKQGVLQDRLGLSFAVEAGLLLPSAVDGEDQTGFEAIGIVSGTLSDFTWHLNLGAGIDRTDHRSFGLWGVVVEHPLSENWRLVAELNGESLKSEAADSSGLLGVVWEPLAIPDLALDGGIRHGLSRAAPDWGATLGMTFSFR